MSEEESNSLTLDIAEANGRHKLMDPFENGRGREKEEIAISASRRDTIEPVCASLTQNHRFPLPSFSKALSDVEWRVDRKPPGRLVIRVRRNLDFIYTLSQPTVLDLES